MDDFWNLIGYINFRVQILCLCLILIVESLITVNREGSKQGCFPILGCYQFWGSS